MRSENRPPYPFLMLQVAFCEWSGFGLDYERGHAHEGWLLRLGFFFIRACSCW